MNGSLSALHDLLKIGHVDKTVDLTAKDKNWCRKC